MAKVALTGRLPGMFPSPAGRVTVSVTALSLTSATVQTLCWVPFAPKCRVWRACWFASN